MWIKLMKIGSMYGCHQMSCRSFFIGRYQFFICARCTGVLLGSIFAYSFFMTFTPSILLCLIGCAIIFTDWLVQHLGIKESTNIRRLITGIIGGYAVASLFCIAVGYVISLIL